MGTTVATGLGFRQRKTQRAALKILRGLGFDSMSFTQMFKQQIAEIREDMQDTVNGVNRSVTSWKEGKFDAYVRDKTKRRMLADYMDSRTPKTASAVRIIQKNHQYVGERAKRASCSNNRRGGLEPFEHPVGATTRLLRTLSLLLSFL